MGIQRTIILRHFYSSHSPKLHSCSIFTTISNVYQLIVGGENNIDNLKDKYKINGTQAKKPSSTGRDTQANVS